MIKFGPSGNSESFYAAGYSHTEESALFVKERGDTYTRLDETHTQYIYTEREITDALEANGFTLLGLEGHLGEEKENSDRWCFVARKGGQNE